eukprot:COSAG06_NODE_6668_length_2834_cov_3.785009_3_plen_47_part_00
MAFQNTANILNEIQQHFGDSGGGGGGGVTPRAGGGGVALQEKSAFV